MMLKKTIIFSFLCICSLIYPQATTKLHGTILTEENINDTITFVPGLFFDGKYFENEKIRTKITNNQFYLNFSSHYPQMYVLELSSEKKNGRFRIDYCFIDNTTTDISFTQDYKIKTSDGFANTEFLEKFLPYILKGEKEDFDFYNFNESFDEKLYSYTKENPDSYVALWFLIRRFNQEGYTELYEKCLKIFSEEMKNESLWNILNEEFLNISIKTNHKFPEIPLKNTSLNPETLQIPEAEYTLIDFWFSRCRPCLEEIPQWIDLYERYNSKGLNIIGISTDKTENVEPYWQKRIIEKKIPWKNYLDENAVFASKEKIFLFPTNYLLNSKGEVIRKNIKPKELENLLIDSYKIKKHFDNYVRQTQVPLSIFKKN